VSLKKQLIDLAVGVIVGDMGDWTAVHIQVPSLPECLAEENGLHLDAYRTDSLDQFLDLTARTNIRRAA
jgi:hypothetical protein